ncbi:unnamed protein product [Pedinophyceae sp. YPF-701]|nr:unnamed protein product [Pedinophyceae sp. YPF-701]
MSTTSSAGRAAPAWDLKGPLRFTLSTLNLRSVMDRWSERRPLLRDTVRRTNAHVHCFQEVLTASFGQDTHLLGHGFSSHGCTAALDNVRAMGRVGACYAWVVDRCASFPPTRSIMHALPGAVESARERWGCGGSFMTLLKDLTVLPFYGNSICTRQSAAHVHRHEVLRLGRFRSAQRALVVVDGAAVVAADSAHSSAAARRSGGAGNSSGREGARAATAAPRQPSATREESGEARRGSGASADADGRHSGQVAVWVVNAHLDHENERYRERQAAKVLRWMEGVEDEAAGVVIAGDFNARPTEAMHKLLLRNGYRSAYAARHGKEPERTWPSGIRAPLADTGDPECVDYIYYRPCQGYAVRVTDAELTGTEHDRADDGLYPTDHYGIVAKLEVSPLRGFAQGALADVTERVRAMVGQRGGFSEEVVVDVPEDAAGASGGGGQ